MDNGVDALEIDADHVVPLAFRSSFRWGDLGSRRPAFATRMSRRPSRADGVLDKFLIIGVLADNRLGPSGHSSLANEASGTRRSPHRKEYRKAVDA